MKSRRSQIVLGVLIFIGASIMLKYGFGMPNIIIVVMFLTGIIGGVLGRLFAGFVLPSEWLFKSRFILYGLGFGLLIGILNFSTRTVEINEFRLYELIKALIISTVVGVIILGPVTYVRYNLLKKKTRIFYNGDSVISDFVFSKDMTGHLKPGMLVMTKERLLFYSSKDRYCLFDIALNEINPKIDKDKFLGIPRGLSFGENKILLYVMFPYLWMKLFEENSEHMA